MFLEGCLASKRATSDLQVHRKESNPLDATAVPWICRAQGASAAPFVPNNSEPSHPSQTLRSLLFDSRFYPGCYIAASLTSFSKKLNGPLTIHIKSETCINGDPGSKVQSLPINSVSRYVPWQTVGANLPKHVERPSNHKRFSESLDKMILGVRSLGDYCDTPIQREF